jgi:hypothetical protein
MTTLGYEERLVEFATGKRLRRFRGVLRAPGDTSCDACGSSMPNFLYGLRDLVESRDYFVGANCFQRLRQLGAFEQPYVRMSIATAYLRSRGAPAELHIYYRFRRPAPQEHGASPTSEAS